MPYKDKKKLYEAQKKYRKKKRKKLEEARQELRKPKPNIPLLRDLLEVELRETADSMDFSRPSRVADHILSLDQKQKKKPKKTQKKKRRRKQ